MAFLLIFIFGFILLFFDKKWKGHSLFSLIFLAFGLGLAFLTVLGKLTL